MRRLAAGIAGVALATLAIADVQAADPPRKTPYFASITPGRARMRSGPGRTYPATWMYVRADLPVKVVDVFKEWRKVEDPDGTQGWMLANLIGSTRTAVVQGSIVELRNKPNFAGKLLWRAEPGVIGRLSQCRDGWCRFDVKGQAGFVEATRLWGVDSEEVLP